MSNSSPEILCIDIFSVWKPLALPTCHFLIQVIHSHPVYVSISIQTHSTVLPAQALFLLFVILLHKPSYLFVSCVIIDLAILTHIYSRIHCRELCCFLGYRELESAT